MVFIKDEDSIYDAPLELVWQFFGSGPTHSDAHHHRNARRRKVNGDVGIYSWEQDFEGKPTRFSMKWHAYYPMGFGYQVLEGPFKGSNFFLFYERIGKSKTKVNVIGEFTSKTIPERKLKYSVLRFFEKEFEEDVDGIRVFQEESEF